MAALLAAVVALDLAQPVQAQSDDERGRIVARRLDDGRTEFGWQPAGAARVLPRARYFPADARPNRWLNSSPVEVGGAEIGRINARLRSDGRIEFAFTPTDRERILTDARYFPTNARPNRWLRSTQIAISAAPATGFVAISAGNALTCAIRAGSGAITCWGWNEYGQTDAPTGSFTAVAAGGWHSCAIRAESGAIECWGSNSSGETDAPAGSFTAIAAGGGHNCAIRAGSGAIECWGSNDYGQSDAPEGSFTAVSAGYDRTCAIRENSDLECWGFTTYGERTTQTFEGGGYSAVSVGAFDACTLVVVGEIWCWGNNDYGQSDAPAGRFSAMSAGGTHSCAIREDGAIECWGSNRNGETDAPAP